MRMVFCFLLFSFHSLAVAGSPAAAHATQSQEVETTANDGVRVFGEQYFGTLDAKAPLILLFHQAGSNGRGEYGDLIPWLQAAGFRAIAWDLRSGKARFDHDNRTASALNSTEKISYCDVSPDLQAALDYVVQQDLAEKVVVWGSSYTASLVFKLAADNPQRIAGVAAFSPAAGGPMVDCRARMWVDQVQAPVIVFRPEKEMELASSQEQRDILVAAGAEFHVIANAVHGSSMLVDARSKHDMQAARDTVEQWLKGLQ
ncbi:alpha/beta hydrolase [Marinicella meishanensis]|uniref:alpha/beta hydrolase n=1 Tax=Marinicella meishanensis TaxID=2873263 RepID=UPI001CBBBB0B|nr:alpha/beta fold hydrolase [Marinicella sp. NBU2979]